MKIEILCKNDFMYDKGFRVKVISIVKCEYFTEKTFNEFKNRINEVQFK